jgi:hypothetical protein
LVSYLRERVYLLVLFFVVLCVVDVDEKVFVGFLRFQHEYQIKNSGYV